MESRALTIFTLGVSTLGFMSDLTDFIKAAGLPKIPESLRSEKTGKTVSNSFAVYRVRDNNTD